MDPVIEKALKKLRELEREVHRLNQFISTYEVLTGTKVPRDELLAIPTLSEQSENTSGTQDATPPAPRKRNNPTRIAEMVERIILELNRPLARGEIVKELESRDVKLESDDKAKYVGTILWRHRAKFRNIEGVGYWVEGKPLPGSLGVFN